MKLITRKPALLLQLHWYLQVHMSPVSQGRQVALAGKSAKQQDRGHADAWMQDVKRKRYMTAALDWRRSRGMHADAGSRLPASCQPLSCSLIRSFLHRRHRMQQGMIIQLSVSPLSFRSLRHCRSHISLSLSLHVLYPWRSAVSQSWGTIYFTFLLLNTCLSPWIPCSRPFSLPSSSK